MPGEGPQRFKCPSFEKLCMVDYTAAATMCARSHTTRVCVHITVCIAY